jgi:hypothetical protein
MNIATIQKQPLQVRRITVDFTKWLDPNETLSAVTTPAVTNEGEPQWQIFPYPPTGLTPPVDTNPLTVTSSLIINAGTQVQLFLQNGTPGISYQVQFVATGMSTRHQPIEIVVQVQGP